MGSILKEKTVKKKSPLRLLVGLVTAFLFITALNRHFFARVLELPQVPSFQFEDSDGRIFTSNDLQGKVWIAAFFTSSCHAACRIEGDYLKDLQNQWKHKGLNLVSFSMDPKNDTPSAMARFAQAHHADGESWHFLTGNKNDLYRLAQQGFKVNGVKDALGPLPEFIHTTRIVLVGQHGKIHGDYDSASPVDQAKLQKDLQGLLGDS